MILIVVILYLHGTRMPARRNIARAKTSSHCLRQKSVLLYIYTYPHKIGITRLSTKSGRSA